MAQKCIVAPDFQTAVQDGNLPEKRVKRSARRNVTSSTASDQLKLDPILSDGRGPFHSPLDDIRPERWTSQFTTELLELFWVLEATIDIYTAQAALFEAILASYCFRASELPAVPEPMPSPKKAKPGTGDPFDFEK